MRKFATLLLLAAAVGAGDAVPARLPPAASFESDPQPVPVTVEGNPLRYAAARIGLDLNKLELPRAYESGYRTVARFPVIDAVANRPLYMKQWAEDTSARIRRRHEQGGLLVLEDALALLRGTEEWEVPEVAIDPEVLAETAAWLETLPFDPTYRQALGKLVTAYIEAAELARRGSQELSQAAPAVLAELRKNPGYYLAPDGKKMPSLTGSVDTHLRFIAQARRLDLPVVFASALHLSRAIRAYVIATAGGAPDRFFADPKRVGERFSRETVAGRITICGVGDDIHAEDAGLLIDLGGDDFYRNNAGAGRRTAAACIDHGGNDRYYAPTARYVQGFGFLGCGFLVDLGGNDHYRARHFSQAAGICGVGVLWDRKGDDVYDAHAFCQGAGMFGLGLLLDGAGADHYDCATLGQGAATTLGLGLLSDLDGDDRYHLAVDAAKDALGGTPGYGQGGALSFRHLPWRGTLTPYGGAGVLLDHGGNDRYRSRGWCDQGGSYLLSLGALVDDDGNDHYSAHCGQGSGIHVTNAILIDRAGHDIYEGEFRCGGSGGDRSPGILIDYGGNDVYSSRTSSYASACKPFAFSLLIDYQGEDRYICPEPTGAIEFNNFDSFGSVWPESHPHLWMHAIALDLGGHDEYAVRHRANDAERHSFGHGLHLDTTWKGGDVIGRIASPLSPRPRVEVEGLERFGHPDTFERFRATTVSEVAPLVDLILSTDHRGTHRDVLEVIHASLVNGGVEDEKSLLRLLGSADPEVRAIAADDCSIWKRVGTEPALATVVRHDPDPGARRLALRALRLLEYGEAIPSALHDADPGVRREAVRLLESVGGDAESLRRVLRIDPDSGVRAAAADALGRLRVSGAVPDLADAGQSDDVYLRRAAGRALAELGHVEGLELLIESLSFPSIDAFDNYGRNVVNSIALYAGRDFPEDLRYSQKRWQRWMRRNRDRIDIARNLEAQRTWEELGPPVEERLDQYERFLTRYPGHPAAVRDLARALNEWAWKLATATPKSGQSDLEKAQRLATRAVELDPAPSYQDTLAEALFALGKLDESERICRNMLALHPDQRMFAERLARIAKLKQPKKPPPPPPAKKPPPPAKPPAPPPKK